MHIDVPHPGLFEHISRDTLLPFGGESHPCFSFNAFEEKLSSAISLHKAGVLFLSAFYKDQ